MNNMQLYFAIGIPTFTVLVGMFVGVWQSMHIVNRFSAVEGRLDARMAVIETDIKTIVRIIGDLDVRLARLEERTAR